MGLETKFQVSQAWFQKVVSNMRAAFTKKANSVKRLADLNWEALVDGDIDTLQFREPWVLPHIMAFLAKPKVVILERNDDNKISATLTLKTLAENLDAGNINFEAHEQVTKKAFQGMLNWITTSSRSSILPEKTTQSSREWCRFGGIVPLFLSAFKEYRNVSYSQWDFADPKLKHLVDKSNLEVLQLIGTPVPWDSTQLQEFLVEGRKYKSGPKIGMPKHLNLCSKLNETGDEQFDSLPNFVRSMLCQTWLYQPEYYTQFGVYNLNNADSRPSEDISKELLKETTSKESPW